MTNTNQGHDSASASVTQAVQAVQGLPDDALDNISGGRQAKKTCWRGEPPSMVINRGQGRAVTAGFLLF